MLCRPAVTATLGAVLLLGGCAGVPGGPTPSAPPAPEAARTARLTERALALDRLLPAAVLLIGEQHDAPEHQALQARVVGQLAARGLLAALVLEMAERGGTTDGLGADASEDAVRAALAWSDRAWPWTAYGPAVMTAVRAGVPVRGGNLPRAAQAGAAADASLDRTLTPEALQRLQRLVDQGHCGLLPASRVPAMTRIQIARDRAMAAAVVQSLRPGSTVVLLAGQTHVSRELGVPRHLAPEPRVRVLMARAGDRTNGVDGDADLAPGDLLWPTPPVPPVDACASLRPPAR